MQEGCLKDYKKPLRCRWRCKRRYGRELTKNDLIQATGHREEICIEKAADEVDEIQLAMNRVLAIRNLDRETTLLRHVAAALACIEDGRFGTCFRCEEEIPEKRLKAVPWAAYCVSCQEYLDQNQVESHAKPSVTRVDDLRVIFLAIRKNET
jgi:DnaK suppressor protein